MEEIGYRLLNENEPRPKFCRFYQSIHGYIYGFEQVEFGLCGLENRFMNCHADSAFCDILKRYNLEGYKK